MSKNIFIIHFLPLEGYPPIQNLLDFFSSKKSIEIICCSTKGKLKANYVNRNNCRIKRLGIESNNKISLWLTYLFFNIFSVFLLLLKRPQNVMYYETISSFPAYFYKKYINKKANIFIHYHEYVTKQEYMAGSPITRYFHELEKQIYKEVRWISHTNEIRLKKFLTDNNISYSKDIHHINPNYPSIDWGEHNIKWNGSDAVRLIFVGYSVDPSDCFIQELIEWLANQKQATILDLYCVKQKSLPAHFLGKKGNTNVRILSPVAYQDLPPIVKNYHVGLILYRGLTPNYIFNAPNKLFEYLACDLDVWFPKEMKGCYSYRNNEFTPQVLQLDFNNLDCITIGDLINTNKLKSQESIYYYENIYDLILKELH